MVVSWMTDCPFHFYLGPSLPPPPPSHLQDVIQIIFCLFVFYSFLFLFSLSVSLFFSCVSVCVCVCVCVTVSVSVWVCLRAQVVCSFGAKSGHWETDLPSMQQASWDKVKQKHITVFLFYFPQKILFWSPPPPPPPPQHMKWIFRGDVLFSNIIDIYFNAFASHQTII